MDDLLLIVINVKVLDVISFSQFMQHFTYKMDITRDIGVTLSLFISVATSWHNVASYDFCRI